MLKSWTAATRNKLLRPGTYLEAVEEERGSAMVEFALVAPALLAITLGIIEFSGVVFAQNLLEGGANQASRFGIIGSTPEGASREAVIRGIIEKNTFGIIDADDLRIETFAYDSFASVGEPEPFDDANGNGLFDEKEAFQDINRNGERDEDQGIAGAGDSDQVVLYRLTYDWDIMVPIFHPFFGEQVTLQATTAVRNEPFSS
ncbi:MAG: TadE family protein [Geminicoccaceae bacterium]